MDRNGKGRKGVGADQGEWQSDLRGWKRQLVVVVEVEVQRTKEEQTATVLLDLTRLSVWLLY